MESSSANQIHVSPQFCNAIRSTLPGSVNISGNNFNLEIDLLVKFAYACTSVDNIIEEYPFHTKKWYGKYNSLSWDIVNTVLLSETNFPCLLERVKWDGLEKILENKDDLIKQILEFARTIQNVTPPLQHDDTAYVSLIIVQKVCASPQEFELTKAGIVKKQYDEIGVIVWRDTYEVIKDLGQLHEPSLYENLQWIEALEGYIKDGVRNKIDFWRIYFDENYERELVQTLTERARREFISLPAIRSIMQCLQKINNLPEDESTDDCVICKESYSPGSEPYNMPCSHSFQYDCIKTWLLKNTNCPMCRYKLPPMESK
ncbi:hypothetical protein FXO37_20321 [Capsicum annuum]|nr:hypothetical protein FXO37_20321 [Capsicum annuum]